MSSPPQAAGLGLVLALGALLAVMAAAAARWARRDSLARWLLLAGCLLGMAGLVSTSVRRGLRPSTSVTLALAATFVAAGLWSVSLCPQNRRVHGAAGLLAGLAMGAYLFAPSFLASAVQVGGVWFGLEDIFCVLGCGVLLLGSVWGAFHGQEPANGSIESVPTRSILGLGLLLQTVSLGSHAVGAQLAWGAYWDWDPVACWRLVAWLSTAIGAVGLWRRGWRGRRAQVAVTAAAAVVLLVLVGSLPLVRWLGLGSLYLGG